MIKLGIILLYLACLVEAYTGADNPQIIEEKVFSSIVSMSASGNSVVALSEMSVLEQSFKIAYTKLTEEMCFFRSIEDIELIEIKDNVDAPNIDQPEFFLHFKLSVKCFDCSSDAQLFSDDDGSNEQKKAQIDGTCYWNDEMLAERSVSNNMAPSKNDFIRTFTEVSNSRGASSITSAISIADLTTLTDEEIHSCPCPPKSFCTYTDSYTKDFWQMSTGLYHNCTCRDGYYGEDGWRCDRVEECDEDNWKCAPPEEGGFCVRTDPDDDRHPIYKCGCRDGFKANKNYTQDDLHGVMHCIEDDSNEENYENNDDLDLKVTFTSECFDDEASFVSITSLDVIGNPATLIADKEIIEQSMKVAYKNALISKCSFRFLENVTLVAYSSPTGEIIFLSNTTSTRYLRDEKNTNLYLDDTELLQDDDNPIAGPKENNTATLLQDDDDAYTGSNYESYNFTIYISVTMQCFHCPKGALLFNDASRRRERVLLQEGQSLRGVQNDGCFCELDDGSTEDPEVVNIAPSRDDFVQEFNNELAVQEVESVEEVETIKDEQIENGVDAADLAEIIIQSAEQDDCSNRCNPANQFCDADAKCRCKEGFFAPSGVGGKCYDIKECEMGTHDCSINALCIELEGSYACECKDGYEGDGFSCIIPTISSSPTEVPSSSPTTSSPTQTPPCSSFKISLTTDAYPEETSFDLKNECDGSKVLERARGYFKRRGRTYVVEDLCLPAGKYKFTIYDSYGDGLQDGDGKDGNYKVFYDGQKIANGGKFKTEESTAFGSCDNTD